MSAIVCAIRGGPASQPTIELAIELAQEKGLPLFFLYVVNLDFLAHTSGSRVHTISQEMHRMGEFILLMAQARAQERGVSTQGVIRDGRVREEITRLCREVGATYVVLGRPKAEEETAFFTAEMLREFIAGMERETGAKVVLPG